ncbi:hypothetical protein [Streptomyces sp. NPDC093089]|uniref:hypothetical protein n=1 Tax=Streptomyces sp. NPDC093089 TaxID=3366024 RepID=UPI0038255B88
MDHMVSDDSSRLLLWLHGQTRGNVDMIIDLGWDDPPDWQCAPESRTDILVGDLAARRLVTVHPYGGGAALQITPDGVRAAHQAATDRNKPALRIHFAADALVSAAMESEDSQVDVQSFTNSPRAWFHDRQLTPADVARAVEHLEELGLIKAPGTPVVTIALTYRGIECGSREPICVRSAMREQNPQQPHITFHGSTYGVQIGNHNTQNNAYGYPTAELAAFTREVLETVRSADLPDAARNHVLSAGEQLRDQLEAERPEPGLIRRSWESFVLSIMQNLGQSAVGGTVRAIAASHGIELPSSE